MRHNDISIWDRLISTGSYLTVGTIGVIWIIINALFLKKPSSRFIVLNLIQSFIISILFAVIQLAYNIFIGIFVNLPFVGKLFLKMHIFIFETPIFHTMSFINYIIFLFVCYLAILSLLGAVPYVIFVTDIAKKLYR